MAAWAPNLSPVRRWRRISATLTVAWLAFAGSALGHAVPVSTVPLENTLVSVAPLELTMRFSEPVDLLSGNDLEAVDAKGANVTGSGASKVPGDRRSIRVALLPNLPDGTYTVRWQVVSADAHAIAGVYVFGVGAGPLGEPFLGGLRPKGPSDTGPWAVSARFFELVCLGGLIGMLAFRWLVWRRASAPLPTTGEDSGLAVWGRDLHWTGFGLLAAGAMLAEGYLLATKTATILGTSVAGALGRPGDMARVLADTRFGTFAQIRAGLLFGVFVVAIWQFLSELGTRDDGRPATTGKRIPALAMAALTVGAFAAISLQGHASTGRAPLVESIADIAHLVAAAVWIGGMVMVLLVLWRAPKVDAGRGREVAARTLAGYSRVALVAVSVTVATGVVRALGELADPADLWTTAYGRSILIKLALLGPVAYLGLRHRRINLALRSVATPSRAALAMVRRSASLELALGLAIVVVASLLVAQVPPPT